MEDDWELEEAIWAEEHETARPIDWSALAEVDGPLICRCYGIPRDPLVALIRSQAIARLDEILPRTMAGQGCGSCHDAIRRLIEETQNDDSL